MSVSGGVLAVWAPLACVYDSSGTFELKGRANTMTSAIFGAGCHTDPLS